MMIIIIGVIGVWRCRALVKIRSGGVIRMICKQLGFNMTYSSYSNDQAAHLKHFKRFQTLTPSQPSWKAHLFKALWAAGPASFKRAFSGSSSRSLGGSYPADVTSAAPPSGLKRRPNRLVFIAGCNHAGDPSVMSGAKERNSFIM